MKIVTKYVAFDGCPFNSEAECRAYEAKLAHVRLVNLTIEQVEAALDGSDSDLADCIEQIGARIGRARRERGDLRRHRAKDTPPDPTPPSGSASSETTTRQSSESGDGLAGSNGDVRADESEAA